MKTLSLTKLLPRIVVVTSGCWEWQGHRNAKGYGLYSGVYVHRAMYQIAIGPIPDGKEIHHKCENPPCCNPDHLEAVTRREHQDRTPNSTPTVNRNKTHCPRGHEYTPENTRIETRSDGGLARRCLTCERARGARRRRTAPGESNWDLHRADTCKYGHSLADAYIRKNGTRRCRVCVCERQRRYHAAHR